MTKKLKHQDAIAKPSFFAIRFLQLFCCLVVFGILGYFQYNLYNDGYSNPFEFALLDTVAAITLLNITISSFFICCCGLSPLYMLIIDGLLSVFWAVAFGMLVKAMGKTTTQACTIANWGNADGVRICNLYKVLIAFSFMTLFSFVCSFIFAVVIRKRENTTYKYQPADNPAILQSRPTSYTSSHGLTGGTTGPARISFSEDPLNNQQQYSDSSHPQINQIYSDNPLRNAGTGGVSRPVSSQMSYAYNTSENYNTALVHHTYIQPHVGFEHAPSPSQKQDSPLQLAQRTHDTVRYSEDMTHRR